LKDYQLKLEGRKIIIPKGLSAMFPIISFHHDPKYFPEPEKVHPDHFSLENHLKIDPDAYLPFDIGPRNYIGNQFVLVT
jgi:cytochrome P450